MSYITVQELSDYMGINDADDDGALEAAITTACSSIDEFCGRTFVKSTVATARRFHATPTEVCNLDDFWDLASLEVKSDQGNNGTYDLTWTITTHFEVTPYDGVVNGTSGWPYYGIESTGRRYFPTGGIGHRPRVQVTAKWGWSAVPETVITACKIQSAIFFRRKDNPDGPGGFDGTGFAVPMIKPATRLDPHVAQLLTPLRRLDRFA